MLDRKLMIGTDDGALEQAPNVLDGIRMNVSANVFADHVIDGFVSGVLVTDTSIAEPTVCVDRLGIIVNVAIDEAVQFLPAPVACDLESNRPATLRGSHNERVEAGSATLADALL